MLVSFPRPDGRGYFLAALRAWNGTAAKSDQDFIEVRNEAAMTLDLPAELESAIAEKARQCGMTPERYLEQIVEQHFRMHRPMPSAVPPTAVAPSSSAEEKVKRLRAIGRDCGVSLSDEQLSREHMYD